MRGTGESRGRRVQPHLCPDSPRAIMHLCKRPEMRFFWKKGIYACYSLSECSDFYRIRPPTTQVCLLSTSFLSLVLFSWISILGNSKGMHPAGVLFVQVLESWSSRTSGHPGTPAAPDGSGPPAASGTSLPCPSLCGTQAPNAAASTGGPAPGPWKRQSHGSSPVGSGTFCPASSKPSSSCPPWVMLKNTAPQSQCLKSGVGVLKGAPLSPRGLVKAQKAGPAPRSPDPVGLAGA